MKYRGRGCGLPTFILSWKTQSRPHSDSRDCCDDRIPLGMPNRFAKLVGFAKNTDNRWGINSFRP